MADGRKEAATRKLLIAEDESSLRFLVAATLAGEDCDILEAGDGLQALAIVEQQHPDVVLLDVSMPGLNGLEVCRRIRASPELAATRVILLTGAAHPEDRDAGLAAGADSYLTKPFSPLELLQAIERVAP